MSNKTQLQTNNTNLDALIARVNAAKNTAASLPSAGSGGSALETVTITYTDMPDPGVTIIYMDSSMNIQSLPLTRNMSFTTIKNSMVLIEGYMGTSFPSCTFYVNCSNVIKIFQVTG